MKVMNEDCACEEEEEVAQKQKDEHCSPSTTTWSIHVRKPFWVVEGGRVAV